MKCPVFRMMIQLALDLRTDSMGMQQSIQEDCYVKIKKIELKNFKRFTHVIVDNIPESIKLVILVGPNGSGKTSFLESMNHYYKYSGFNDIGDYSYLRKGADPNEFDYQKWYRLADKMVDIDFYDGTFSKSIGTSNIRGHFYFRSAYRNEPDFQIGSMQKQNNPTETIRLQSLIQNDQTVSSNYQRLIADTISGLYDKKNDAKSVETLRDELTGKIQGAVSRVFEDLNFSSLGQPLTNGNFYFTKGTTTNFSYRNLSAGEKAAFDLILDLVIQSRYYDDAIYCIDEPEAHMHTKLQGRILREMYLLIPGHSQLWISTHSIGMLQEAERIEKEKPGTVAFLDFGGRDYDTDQIIRPTKVGKAVLEKFYELALGDFAKLILPQTIVFCEGNSNGNVRKDFDKSIYSQIFENTHPEAFFISGGSCNDIERIESTHGEILHTLLKHAKVIKIVDRDDRSEQEILELSKKDIKVLKKRNLESYLLDDTIIGKLCNSIGKPEELAACLQDKKTAINNSISRGNAEDDIKSARGDIYTSIKKRLGLTQCGNNADSFVRDTLTPLFTPDLMIYKQLEQEIFN